MLRNTVMLIVLLVGGKAERVLAQDSASGQSTVVERPAAAGVTAGQDGFAIQSANGDFRLQIGLLVHADGRFALDDIDEQVVDTFAFRRLRPYLRGRFARRFEFYFNPDFAGGTLVVQDAYVDTVFSPAFRSAPARARRRSASNGCTPASNLLFFNRALPTALVPNRDIGIQVLGDISGGVVSYAAGVMNGVPDGGSADLDTSDGKDLSGRLVVRPFSQLTKARCRGLALASPGSTGHQIGRARSRPFRTPIARAAVFLTTPARRPTACATATRRRPLLLQGVRRLRGVRPHRDADPQRDGARRDCARRVAGRRRHTC